MFFVSIFTSGVSGCLRPPLGGIDTIEPSRNIIKSPYTLKHSNSDFIQNSAEKKAAAEKAAAGGEGDVANFTPTFAANGTVTVQKADSASWMNCYYNITLNLTSGNSSNNKFVEFKAVEFSLAE